MTLFAILAYVGTLVAYGLSALLWIRLLTKEGETRTTAGRIARAVGMCCHIAYLIALGIKYGELPLVSVPNVLGFLALALVIVDWIVEVRSRVDGSGAFVVGLACFLHMLSWPAITLDPPVHEFLRNPVFGVHVLFAVGGYTGFTLSALYGCMYLMQFRALKSLRFKPLFRNLPALDFLDRMTFEGALVGAVSLTLAIFLGLMLSVHLDKPFLTDSKFIQVVIGWLLYVALVVGRYVRGWGGRTVVHLSLTCFGLFVSSSIIVTAFFSTIHDFSK